MNKVYENIQSYIVLALLELFSSSIINFTVLTLKLQRNSGRAQFQPVAYILRQQQNAL